MKRIGFPLAASCLLALSINTASAGAYTGLYVFGDSLSDAGQFPDSWGPANATLRFTNRVGPTYLGGANGEIFGSSSPMLLGEQLGLGPQTPSTSVVFQNNGWADGNNWAVGGYRTDQIYNSITAPGGSVVASSGFVLRQKDGFLVGGGRVDSRALYYVNGGGNDFLQGRVVDTATAQAAGGRLVDSVEALQQAGARYIMVSLLGISGTPSNGGGNAATNALGDIFNAEVITRLRGVNAEIISLNTPLLFQETLANPASFGLNAGTNPAQTLLNSCFDGNPSAVPCPNVNTTYGLGSATPDPTKLMFYDTVHPAEAAQRASADYAMSFLEAPWEISLLPEMAYGTLRGYEDQIRTQWLADANDWQAVSQWRPFVSATGQHLDIDAQDSSASADGNGYSLNLGGSYRLNEDWRAGVAMGAYEQELKAGAANSKYTLDSYLASGFVQYQANRWWADVAFTGGYLDYRDLQRKIELDVHSRTEKADTDGEMWSLSSRVGYDIAQPGSRWHLSPFLSGQYAEVTVDSYSEDSSRSTALNYDEQKRKSKLFGVGLQGSYQLSPQTDVFAQVIRERQYKDDTSDVTMELNTISGIDFTLDGYTPDDSQSQLSLGVNHKLSPGLAVRGGYSYLHSDSVDLQAVNVGLVLDF